MQVLLDTHTFLWWVEDDPQLSTLVRETIEDGDNEVFFSAASGWEIGPWSSFRPFESAAAKRPVRWAGGTDWRFETRLSAHLTGLAGTMTRAGNCDQIAD